LVGCGRLLVLKELIPLVSHFSQLHQELAAWLCDVTGDVDALRDTPGDLTPDTDDHAEQLRMRRYHVKVRQLPLLLLSSFLQVIDFLNSYSSFGWVC